LASNVDAFLVGGDHLLVNAIDSLLQVAGDFKKPVFAVDSASVEHGAVAASAIDYLQLGRRTGEFVCFVIAGADPAAIAAERYSDFSLYVNEAAARQNELTIPPSLLKQAIRSK
jgi:putative ABC transport system substrate-binding protein